MRPYGILLAVGFLSGIYLALVRAERHRLDEKSIRDLCFWLIPVSIAGARLAYLLTHLDEFRGWRAFDIFGGGLVFYGGVAAALGFAIWFCRRRALPFGAVADLYAPSLALGHAFGRVGCWFAGCCGGIQLYEAAGELILFAILVRRPPSDGRIAAAWLFFYASLRFALDPLRTDGFHTRFASLALAAAAAIWFFARRRAR